MLIHKDTFFQAANDGVPSHWVVQFWEDSPYAFPEASYFDSEKGAKSFESTLVSYDDWVTSQEILLKVQ